MGISISTFSKFRAEINCCSLRALVGHTINSLVTAGISIPSCSVSIVIADDETLRTLNLRYRGLNEVTDVLAFPNLADAEESRSHPRSTEHFYTGEDGHETLGEIIVSYPQIRRQSKEHANRPKDELALLIVHGFLHLLGYDHDGPAKEKAMWALQDTVLNTWSSCQSF